MANREYRIKNGLTVEGDIAAENFPPPFSELPDVSVPPLNVETGQTLISSGGKWTNGPVICTIEAVEGVSTLLIPGGGADGSSLFEDGSATQSLLTTVGSGVSYSNVQQHFNQNSIFFSGDSYIQVDDTTGTSFDSLEDFTLRFWVYQSDNTSYQAILSWNDDEYEGLYIYNGFLWWYEWQDDEIPVELPLNQWNYVVVCRFGNKLYSYLNGILINTTPNVGIYTYTGTAAVGVNGTRIDEFFTGYLAELQFFRGVALFQGSQTIPVPSAPLTPTSEGSGDPFYSIGFLDDVDVTTNPPTNGQALVYDAANDVWKPGTSGGGSLARQDLQHITVSLAPEAIEDFTIPGGNVFQILSVEATSPVWVRVYGTSSARSADPRTQPGGVPPLAGTDYYAEFATVSTPQTIRFSPVPVVQGTGGDAFIRAVNTDTVSRVITLTFSVLTLDD